MEYRQLGKTDLFVSKISFGTSALGAKFFPGCSEKEGIKAVHYAFEQGINLYDTSPYYGNAEKVLGQALEKIPREAVIISSKTGRFGLNEFDFSPERMRKSVTDTLLRLKTDYLDILICHDIEYVPIQQIIDEALPLAADLKQEGKIRYCGISGYPLNIFQKVIAQYPIDLFISYAHYNLINDQLKQLVPLCEKKGVGILNAAPFVMGLLTKRGAESWHPADEKVRECCHQAVVHCEAKGTSLEAIAIQYCLTQPHFQSLLVGLRDIKEVQQILEWASHPLDRGTYQEIQEIFKEIHNIEWYTDV
jgi:L-galactose dehydrogenase